MHIPGCTQARSGILKTASKQPFLFVARIRRLAFLVELLDNPPNAGGEVGGVFERAMG